MLNTVNRDRESLKRLIESYGKEDVMKYVNHLDESRDDDMNAVTDCLNKISNIVDIDDSAIEAVRQLLEDLVDSVQNEPYELGHADGRNEVEDDFDEQLDEARRLAYEGGVQNGFYDGYTHATGRMKKALNNIQGRGMLGNTVRISYIKDMIEDIAVDVEDEYKARY